MNELHSFIKETFAKHQKFYEIILKQTKIILSKYEKSDFQNKSEESESSDPESLTESTKDRLDQQMEKRVSAIIFRSELCNPREEQKESEVNLEVSEMDRDDKAKYEQEIQQLQQQNDALFKEINKLQEECLKHDYFKTEIQSLKAELTALKTENQNLKIELEQKTGDYTTLSHQIKAISKDKQELHKRASALSSQNEDLQATNQSLLSQTSQLQALQSTFKTAQGVIESKTSNISVLFDTAQKITEQNKQPYRTKEEFEKIIDQNKQHMEGKERDLKEAHQQALDLKDHQHLENLHLYEQRIAKANKDFDKSRKKIQILKEKISEYNHNLELSSSSYIKYFRMTKVLNEKLAVKEQKYTKLKSLYRGMIEEGNRLLRLRENDRELYAQLKSDYDRVFEILTSWDQKDSDKSCILKEILDQYKRICDDYEMVIANNTNSFQKYYLATNNQIQKHNSIANERFTEYSIINQENLIMIDALKKALKENAKSQFGIARQVASQQQIDKFIAKIFKKLKRSPILILEGYEKHLVQKQKKLDKINKDLE
eukprot:CAMPEP_0197017468 /NCGR_PEP_ID=MMETSP1380-20130617/79557_1 /TAXON_ID=5936 /ORGANISM="Euplotes crassus, Strain CT5" /LENGTH=543 /DNA_ID=CAMNT_0042444569 /DNA_START=165 /DNA_END=1797 /DNA_ORIENTATION=-